jgi:hypothetical protein
MQVIAHTGSQDLAEILEQSNVLDITDHGSLRMYTVEFDGQDILIFADSSNNFFSVYPPEYFDAESGGSIHDHTRAINAESANGYPA